MDDRDYVHIYLKSRKIDPDIIRKIENFMTFKQLKKGEMLLRMGEHRDEICLILQGIVRGVYISGDGEEITKCFSSEQQWCCVYNLIQETPSEYWIEALEDCEFASFPVKQIKQLMAEMPELKQMFEELFIDAFISEQQRTLEFQKMSAAQRYQEFERLYPDRMERVDQKYIASYLGITASSLSRIRKQLRK